LKAVAALLAGLLLSIGVFAASGNAGGSTAPSAPPSPAATPAVAGASAAVPSIADERLRQELANAASRLTSLETSIAKSGEKADQVALRTSTYALYTALGAAFLAALFSFVAQALLMWHQRGINRADSEAKVANTYIEWQLQQLSELYGPIRALLGQSNVLYRQMNRALVARAPEKFKLIPGDDFDGQEFQIFHNGAWLRFRTVKHLEEVYNKDFGVEPYFDDVVDVGERLVDVIREKAGFARPEDDALVKVMGDYLAHYLVLRRLLNRAKDGEKLHVNAADEHATFPNQIQELVDNGFKAINEQVMEWRNFSGTQRNQPRM
jgi:hypothetical protein